MKQRDAREALGLGSALADLSADTITQAYRAALMANHPDRNGGKPGPRTVDELTTAKKTLLTALDGADLSCKGCKGSGKVRAKFGVVTCISCSGTGDRQP